LSPARQFAKKWLLKNAITLGPRLIRITTAGRSRQEIDYMTSTQQILSEDPLGLSALAKRIRSNRRQGSVTPQALWRWAVRGIQMPDGQLVRLEVIRLAGRYLTSWAAFERFVAAQQTNGGGAVMPAPTRSPAKRERSSKKAEHILTRAGS
jgi:hypothetical protein